MRGADLERHLVATTVTFWQAVTKCSARGSQRERVLMLGRSSISFAAVRDEKSKKPAGHLGWVIVMIGTMSGVLAEGLGMMGLWDQVNEMGYSWWAGLGDGVREVPRWVELAFVCGMAFVTPALMLQSPAAWRKWVIWVGMMILYVAWLPVLALAAWRMGMAAPFIAGLWSGICATIFALRHDLPCEKLVGMTAAEGVSRK